MEPEDGTGVYVNGLKEEIVDSPERVLELMNQGIARRHVGETNMNAASSRSHTIFRMVRPGIRQCFGETALMSSVKSGETTVLSC